VVSCDARFEDKSKIFFLSNENHYFLPELSALVTHSQQFGADLLQAASEGSVLQQFTDVVRSLVELQSSE
jgi:hypothetical protein